jgi:hypothetical protein
MRGRRIAVATLAVATVAVAGAGIGVAAASGGSHTVTFTAQQLKGLNGGKTFDAAEVDKVHGKVVGFDTYHCTFNQSTHKAKCDAAFSQPKGLVYVTATITQQGTGSGTVTGGSGSYAHAKGTVTLAPGKHNTTQITITYS